MAAPEGLIIELVVDSCTRGIQMELIVANRVPALSLEEATVASSNPSPPLRGLGAHCDQWAAIFNGKSDDAPEGSPAYARPLPCDLLCA